MLTHRAERRARRLADQSNIARDGERIRVTMHDAAMATDLATRFPPTPTGESHVSHREQRRLARQSQTDDVVAVTLAAVATHDAIARNAIAVASHFPGFRCFTDDVAVDLGAGERARQERITEDSNAW
jgi:hypothetical protein